MWQTVNSKKILEHPRITVFEDEIILPDGNKTDYVWIDSKGEAASVICRRKDGKILLQKEYSYPPNQIMYQLPGGLIPEREDLKTGANRELMEESKIKAKKLKLLGSYFNDNRRKKSKMYVFLATELVKEELPHDPEEFIENFWFTEKEIDKMIKIGEIVNPHLLACWCLYKVKES